MATVDSPLFSLTSSGTLKNLLTYTHGINKAVVKGNRLEKSGLYHFRVKPYFSETRDQLGVRENFKNAIESWNDLTVQQKDEYKEKVKGKPITAVGQFVKEFMSDNYDKEEYQKFWLFGIGAGESIFLFEKDFMLGAMLSMGVND